MSQLLRRLANRRQNLFFRHLLFSNLVCSSVKFVRVLLCKFVRVLSFQICSWFSLKSVRVFPPNKKTTRSGWLNFQIFGVFLFSNVERRRPRLRGAFSTSCKVVGSSR